MTKRTVTIVTTAPANTWLYVQQNAEHIEKIQAYRDAGKLTTATTTSTVAADANDVHPARKGQTLDVTTTVQHGPTLQTKKHLWLGETQKDTQRLLLSTTLHVVYYNHQQQ